MYTKTKLRSKQDPNKFEKVYAELENLYNDNLRAGEIKLNKRNSLAAALIITATILLLVILIQTIIEPNTINITLVAIAVGLIFITPLLYIKQSSDETSFPRRFKEIIIGTLIRNFGKNLVLNPENIDKEEIIQKYKAAGYEVYSIKYHSHIDDVITGNLNNGKHIRMSEAHFQRYSGKRTIHLFGGMFIETTLSKSIKDEIRVLLPSFDEIYNLDSCTKVELDHHEFENIFNVYTTNQISAVQLLTSEALEKLTSLRNDYGMNFDFVIKGNKLFIRLETGTMFETAVQRSKLHKEDILAYYSILSYIELLVNELNNIIDTSSI